MELSVSPAQLRATANRLADVSHRMSAVLHKLDLQLGGEGAPWGDDSTGDQFAEGGKGYLAQRDWVDKSTNAKVDLLNGYSRGLRTVADTLEQQDQEQPTTQSRSGEFV
jgi:hypothetical protein